MKKPPQTITMFEAAFGSSKARKSTWDALSFTDSEPEMVFQYVGWVDVMGASHMMRRSIDAASKSIGRLHEAVLRAKKSVANADDVRLHPLTDGVYIVSKTYKPVSDILRRVFRSYAHTCLSIKSDSRFCPIRAAIAYGRVVDEEAYLQKLLGKLPAKSQTAAHKAYLANVIHGRAYAAAHDAEHSAPPFGIYHDESLREFGETEAKNPVSWPLEKWWCFGHSATEEQQTFAHAFGRRLLDHFEWVKSHPIDSEMPCDDNDKKIETYKRQIKEYFGIVE